MSGQNQYSPTGGTTLVTADSKTDPKAQPAGGGGAVSDDDVNLLEITYVLVKYKVIIILFTLVGLIGGYMAARAKGPAYAASAVIMAKESDKQSPNLGMLGALGSFAAGQLNLATNPGLEKIEVHFDSRQFQAEFIEKYGLLDDVYKYGLPRKYKKYYDTTNNRWIENEKFPAPEPRKAAEFFGKKFVTKETDTKKGTLTLSVKSGDSLFTSKVIEGSLEYLNRYIQTNVQKDAKDNVDFLEKQLIAVADPLLREKLQGMIAAEIEKAMIISKEAFKVIDKPFCMKKHKEKIIYPIVAAFAMFLLSSAAAIFFYYVIGAGNTNSESRRWVGLIRREFFKVF
jgi:LPS O-antigen subunit length determinant protein (WzzB/FepE family)